MAGLFSTTVTRTSPFRETGGSRYCEPYVLVTRIDLRHPWPEVEVFLYGLWHSTNPEDTAAIRPLIWQDSIWKLDVTALPNAKPDDMFFLIALMEHVGGNPSNFRLIVKQAVLETLNASVYTVQEAPVARLIDVINKAIDCANGGPNFGSPIEVVLTANNILDLKTRGFCRFALSFCGYGGHYCLNLQFIGEESDLRDLVPRQDEAFACAAE